MPIEWGWLRGHRPLAAPHKELVVGTKSEVTVMLLHGLTGTPAELAYVARYLHVRGGRSVWCPQLVNHGQPLGVLARTRAHELYDSARAHFLEARSVARARGGRVVVGGLSLGAILSLLLAVEFPDDVAGVMCLAPTLFYDGWNVPRSQRLIPFIDYTPLKYLAFYREEAPYGLKDEALRERVASVYEGMSLHDRAAGGQHGYAHFPVRLFCESRHLISRCMRALPQISAPLLLVQAENDDATSPRNSDYIHKHAGSAHKEMVLLKDSYHIVTADVERATVGAAMKNFCEVVAGGSLRPHTEDQVSDGETLHA